MFLGHFGIALAANKAALARKALAELRKADRLGIIAPGAYRQRRARFEQRLARLERKAGLMLRESPASEIR